MMKGPFSRKQLYASNRQRTYTHQATQAAFLLGGIGTGNVSLAASGELRDLQLVCGSQIMAPWQGRTGDRGNNRGSS